MAINRDEIIADFEGHIRKFGGALGEWCVGTAKDRHGTFFQQRVAQRWAYFPSSAVLKIGTSTMLLTSTHEPRWTHEEPQTNANNAYVCATRWFENAYFNWTPPPPPPLSTPEVNSFLCETSGEPVCDK